MKELLAREPEGDLAWRSDVKGTEISCFKCPYDGDVGAPYMSRAIEFRGSQSGVRFLSARCVEWQADENADYPDDLIQLMDAIGGADSEMAMALSLAFPWEDSPFDNGTVVRIETLAIETISDLDRKAWNCIAHGLDREFGGRASVYILKAFPLEYEESEGLQERFDFKRRSEAMIRLYSSRLGALVLRGRPGLSGWMILSMDRVAHTLSYQDVLPEG